MSLKELFTQTLSELSSSPVNLQPSDYSSSNRSDLLSKLDELIISSSDDTSAPDSTAAAAKSQTTTDTETTDSDVAGAGAGYVRQRRIDFSRALLVSVVKLAFSRDGRKEVTAAGRKAMEQSYRPPVPYDSDEIRASKSWKYGEDGEKDEGGWVVDVFGWCLEGLDAESIEPNWPLLIPPILSTIDDTDTPWRVRGCGLLQTLLNVTPITLLQRTGIGEVFEQALFPYLLHLPPLTEESETMQLLSVVYPALLQLIRVRFACNAGEKNLPEGKVKVLDRIVRQEILRSLKSVGDNVSISILLLKQLAIFVAELQIESVRHLKLIVSTLEERLVSPFATASPSYLQQTLETLRTVQLNAWPRIAAYRLRITTSISILWCRMADEKLLQKQGFQASIRMIQENVKILRTILSAAAEGSGECEELLACDDRLDPLLKVWASV